MNRFAVTSAVVVSVAAFCATTSALAQAAAERFTATASVRTEAATTSADVQVTVSRYLTEEQRAPVIKAIRAGGSAAVQKTLAALPDAGFIQVRDRRTPIKFASTRSTGGGHLVTVVTAEPIAYLGGDKHGAKPRAGYDVAIALLEVRDGDSGIGEIAPAAKLTIDEQGALRIEDYGATVVWLKSVARAK